MATDVDPDLCLLCGEQLAPEDLITIKELSINSLRTICLKKDHTKKNFALGLHTTLNVYKVCNTTFRRKNKRKKSKKDSKSKEDQARELADASEFDFNKLCFLCGKNASDDFIKNEKKTTAPKM